MRTQFPNTTIVFVSSKPSILRWSMKKRMVSTNRLIRNYIEGKPNAVFVTIWDKILKDGEPMKDIFIEDNLHLNAKGYAICTKEMNDLVIDNK
jgi:hypothetical protein